MQTINSHSGRHLYLSLACKQNAALTSKEESLSFKLNRSLTHCQAGNGSSSPFLLRCDMRTGLLVCLSQYIVNPVLPTEKEGVIGAVGIRLKAC